MTMNHGTQPKTTPNKGYSDGEAERKRGVKPTLPPRDGTTRTEGVSEKHRRQDHAAKQSDKTATEGTDLDENLRE